MAKKSEKKAVVQEELAQQTETDKSQEEQATVTQDLEVQENVEAAAEDQPEEETVEADEETTEEDKNRGKGEWYIIQTYSGQEYKVRRSLEQRMSAFKLQDKIFEILIPEEDIIEVKNNKKVESAKKMYPGYIFVRMIFDDELWYIMKRIPGLSKFMGNQKTPIPVKDDEMLKVLRQVGVKVQKYQIDFEVGDMVKIIAGPFRGYTGPVKEINAEKGKLKSMLLIFGRETPVEIDFDQVEKASK
ncbi:MAG: transcription termination/antitermination protein NusG [Candidatus Margulisbacteria bacterium]|nr:transcription termination/antitermination protein NusG [Candidatus Margulisiibacteriota bacterium]